MSKMSKSGDAVLYRASLTKIILTAAAISGVAAGALRAIAGPEYAVAAIWCGWLSIILFLTYFILWVRVRKPRPRHTNAITISCLVAAVIATGITIRLVHPGGLRTETESHGPLVPANDPSPRNPCLGELSDEVKGVFQARGIPLPPHKTMPAGTMFYYAGGNVAYTMPGAPTHAVMIEIAGRPLITVDGKDGTFSVSGDVLDETGKVVAHLKENELTLVPGESAYRERRPDQSTLVVYGRKGEQLFMVRYLNPTVISLTGTFPLPNGPPVIVTDSSAHLSQSETGSSGGCAGNDGGAVLSFGGQL